jgi:hypothetical protein
MAWETDIEARLTPMANKEAARIFIGFPFGWTAVKNRGFGWRRLGDLTSGDGASDGDASVGANGGASGGGASACANGDASGPARV